MTEKISRLEFGDREVVAGENVVVKPSAPGRRDGFVAKFLSATITDSGVQVDVFGAHGRKAPSTRTFVIDRIAPVPLPRRKRQRRTED